MPCSWPAEEPRWWSMTLARVLMVMAVTPRRLMLWSRPSRMLGVRLWPTMTVWNMEKGELDMGAINLSCFEFLTQEGSLHYCVIYLLLHCHWFVQVGTNSAGDLWQSGYCYCQCWNPERQNLCSHLTSRLGQCPCHTFERFIPDCSGKF